MSSKSKLRHVLFLTLLVLFGSAVSFAAFAHGGDTDSIGGHYDKSTGEYHYHHGYPAHQHKDLDGDGVIDCPYNFVDKTGSKSGASGAKNNEEGKNKMNYQVLTKVFFFAFLLFVASTIVLIIKLKEAYESNSNYISKMRESEDKHRRELQKAKIEANSEKISELESQIKEREIIIAKYKSKLQSTAALIDNCNLYAAVGAPKNATVEYGFPKIADKSGLLYGRPYTVFIRDKGSLHYHFTQGCSGAFVESNFYLEDTFRMPCSKCAKNKPDISWLRNYIDLKEFVDDYIEDSEK